LTRSSELQIPGATPLILAEDPTDFEGLVPVKDNERADIALVRTDDRTVAIVALHPSAAVSVNGESIPGGLYFASSNAVVHLIGSRSCRFALLFDDGVQEAPSGVTCDVCGKVLQEPGKRHCRHVCCKECLDVFRDSCPDCGKNLGADDDSSANVEALREYL
jgi:hypothetical protein